MITLLTIVLSILLVAEFVLGNFVNCSIVLVNCKDWIERQRISFVDQILMALAISRLVLLWVITSNWITAMFFEDSYTSEAYIIFDITWTVSNHSSTWLATSLSIFFLLKIASFSSPLFHYLKRSIKKVLLIMALGSLAILTLTIAAASKADRVWTPISRRNTTRDIERKEIICLPVMIAFTATQLIPFTMSLTSFVLLLFSLDKHLKRMKRNGEGSRDPSTTVHIRAMQMVISFLLLYACYFGATIASIWGINRQLNNTVHQVCEIILALYPSSHSLILIWGNKKLKQAFMSFLWQWRMQ
nr:unnamed protein product [Sorex araneus]